jgi:hypothetical protein
VGALAAVAMAGMQAPAQAQITFEGQVSPMMTGTFFVADPPSRFAIMRQGSALPLVVEEGRFQDDFGVGVNAGVRIAERFGVEGMFFWVPTSLEAENGLEAYGGEVKVNSLMWGATALYYLPRLGDLELFGGLGVGAETVNYEPELAWHRHNDVMGNVVVGANGYFTERLGIRFEVRDCVTRFESHITGIDDKMENDLMISAGLTFRAGFNR